MTTGAPRQSAISSGCPSSVSPASSITSPRSCGETKTVAPLPEIKPESELLAIELVPQPLSNKVEIATKAVTPALRT